MCMAILFFLQILKKKRLYIYTHTDIFLVTLHYTTATEEDIMSQLTVHAEKKTDNTQDFINQIVHDYNNTYDSRTIKYKYKQYKVVLVFVVREGTMEGTKTYVNNTIGRGSLIYHTKHTKNQTISRRVSLTVNKNKVPQYTTMIRDVMQLTQFLSTYLNKN